MEEVPGGELGSEAGSEDEDDEGGWDSDETGTEESGAPSCDAHPPAHCQAPLGGALCEGAPCACAMDFVVISYGT